MRNQNFEVPFLAYYRKEYVEPELDINALWKVYHFDAKVNFIVLKICSTINIQYIFKLSFFLLFYLVVPIEVS